MNKNLYVARKGSLFIILILVFYFLPLQSTSAALMEYSISGNFVYDYAGGAEETLEITGTAFIDDERYNIDNPNCMTGYNTVECDPRYNITNYDMSVGDQYSFTGNGSMTYIPSDIYGFLYGTGDWTEINHTNECGNKVGPCTNFQSYEEWLAFELPSDIWFEAGYLCCNGRVEVSNPDLLDVRQYFSVTMSAVPIPSAVWLFGSGLIGLIGFARRKKS